MLTQKSGVQKTSMETSTEVSEAIIKSNRVLHNFIHHEDKMNFCGDNDDAIDDHRQNMRSLSPPKSTRPTAKAMSVRHTEKILCLTRWSCRKAGWNDPLIHKVTA